MAAAISVELKGFKELQDMLSPTKFTRRLKKHVGNATANIALDAEGAIKDAMAEGKVGPPNAAITVALKGSDRPLFDSGDLSKSINGRAEDWDEAVVGVLKSETITDEETGKTKDILNIARTVHDGATIDVTDKMRAFFRTMAYKFKSGDTKKPWKPLKDSTKVIVIPPRPFLEIATTQEMIKKYRVKWDEAIQAAMSGRD
jgi:hypothetical protein